MKKTYLTLVAFAFGMSVAFAQTTPQTEDPAVNTEETITTDNMSNTNAEASLRIITVEELPAAVQETLQGDEFNTYTIVAVGEVEQQEGATGKFYQASLAESGATEPSLIVLFDEKGKEAGRKSAAAPKQEE